MARIIRKLLLSARWHRTKTSRCLMVVLVVLLVKLIIVLPLFFKLHILPGSAVGESDGSYSSIADFSWRPNLSKVQMILEYLNMTREEAVEHLPLTLDSPLLLSNGSSVCGSGQGDPVDLLFLVHSAPINFQRRLQMRSTVMAERHFHPFKVRVAFLLGQVSNSSLQGALEYEHLLYHDTVQGTFRDAYRNLSHKGVLGFRWAARYCPRAKYLVKMDDDVFFDTYKMLLRYRGMFQDQRRTIFCNVWVRDSMPVYREKSQSQWTVEEGQFQGLKTFPFDYCSGLAVVITGDLVASLYRAAFFTPVFWIDDIYLFGMLPWVAGDVTMMDLGFKSRYVAMNGTEALTCMKTRQHACPVLATNCYTRDDWEVMWNVTYHLHVDEDWKVPYLKVN